jgi:hypothetical protein
LQLVVRPIPGFQEERTFALDAPISIPPKRGWLLEAGTVE